MFLHRIICLFRGHILQKNGIELDISKQMHIDAGFRKLSCFRCHTGIIVRRDTNLAVLNFAQGQSESFVAKCGICGEIITTKNRLFHHEGLCKTPIRKEFKEYLVKQGFSEEEIIETYQQAMLQFRSLDQGREITVEVYTRDMLTLKEFQNS